MIQAAAGIITAAAFVFYLSLAKSAGMAERKMEELDRLSAERKAGGSVWAGYAMALAGFACSVAGSCGVFFAIYHVYGWLERINVFVIIKKVIRVIVSGLLLTVMAGLIQSGIEMNSNEQLPWFTVLAMIFIIYGLNLFLYHRCKCKNLWMILISLALSVAVCNVIGV